tara:strand:+ start:4433 stop:4888 length:456 start_codon:yes stop_codon:yes gene_type:complete
MPDLPLDTLVIIGLVLASLIGRIFQKKQNPEKPPATEPSSQSASPQPSLDEVLKKAFGPPEIVVEDEYEEMVVSDHEIQFDQPATIVLEPSPVPEPIPNPALSRKTEIESPLAESPGVSARRELFTSQDSLRKAFVLKEILDKPVSLRADR